MTVFEDNYSLRTRPNLAVPVLGIINGLNNSDSLADYLAKIEESLDFRKKLNYVIAGSTASELTDLKWNLTGPVRLIRSLARAWSLNNDELASLLAYSSKAHPAVPGWSICSMKVHAPAISVGREEIWGGWGSIAERVSD